MYRARLRQRLKRRLEAHRARRPVEFRVECSGRAEHSPAERMGRQARRRIELSRMGLQRLEHRLAMARAASSSVRSVTISSAKGSLVWSMISAETPSLPSQMVR